jgi:hypothetical protein
MDTTDARKEIARYLLSYGTEDFDLELEPDLDTLPPEVTLQADLRIPFPDGLAPIPQPIEPFPDPNDPLPEADVVAITWTVDEQDALCDVLTPKHGRATWPRYAKNFAQYEPEIRDHAPAMNARRLGSYMPTKIGQHNVLCMKSELHLNQDGKPTAQPGVATLPVKKFFQQIIAEAKPKLIVTVGTAGSVFDEFPLGDVVVTRGAKFRCHKEFRNAPFNDQAFKSDWTVPTGQIAKAQELMRSFADNLVEPRLGPPTTRFPWDGPLIEPPKNEPTIRLDGTAPLPEFHPILTTDYFEYGTSTNDLDKEGAAVEMGDAVLGLVASEMEDPPKWVVVRNMSDPTINGNLPTKEFRLNEQTMWAVGYYTAYGYWTSVMSALTTWAIIADLDAADLG